MLSVPYRLWAKRKAKHLNEWLATFRPHGMSGALTSVGCQDVLWEVLGDIEDARSGRCRPLFVLSLDQCKCFDRLHIDTLDYIQRHCNLGLDPVLNLDRDLSRLLLVDGQPSSVWPQGGNLSGIPQGCPLATFFCNLTSLAWHRTVQRTIGNHGGKHFSFLDDRLALVHSWAAVGDVLRATQALDLALGPDLNIRKCVRGVACRPGISRRVTSDPSDPGLTAIPRASTFKYLGSDVNLSCSSADNKRPVAKKRCRDFADRCAFIRVLGRRQRPAAVADAMSSLWLAGGVLLSKSQLQKCITQAFYALAGNKCSDGQLKRRSRAIAHVLGPGPHVTYAPSALIYCWMRNLWRSLLSGRLEPAIWQQRWARRRGSVGGPIHQPHDALKFLGISWVAPFRFMCRGHRLDFSIPFDAP